MISRLKGTKNNPKILSNDNITIDAKHNEMINHFKNLQDSTPSLKNELKKLIIEYNQKDPNRKNDIEYIIYRDTLREKINDIKTKINSISNNEEINKYFLDVGTLLHSYYENIENSKNINYSENFEENLLNYEDDIDQIDEEEIMEDTDENSKKENYNSVLNFFNNRQNEETIENEILKNDGVYTSMKISDFVKEESTFKKKNVLDEYLQKIDPNYISKLKIDANIFKCKSCDQEMVLYHSDGIQICENCGQQENILIESDKPSFKDPPLEICYFSYKRINHYNELGIYDIIVV